jgi:hypothetical protein
MYVQMGVICTILVIPETHALLEDADYQDMSSCHFELFEGHRQRKHLIVEKKIWILPHFHIFFPNVKFWQVIYYKFEAKCIFSPIFTFFSKCKILASDLP